MLSSASEAARAGVRVPGSVPVALAGPVQRTPVRARGRQGGYTGSSPGVVLGYWVCSFMINWLRIATCSAAVSGFWELANFLPALQTAL